jgi:hypothetical protein
LIINNSQVRNSGYLTRKLSLLVLNQKLDPNTKDCGSKNHTYVYIENQSILNRFNKRTHVVDGEYHTVNASDKTLIGKKLKLRSPMTCISKGDYICETCYGELSKINTFHISLTGILYFTQQIMQMLLSSKHLLQVNAVKVDIPKSLDPWFYLEKDVLIAKSSFTVVLDTVMENEENEQLYIDEMTIIDSSQNEHHLKLDNIELLLDIIGAKHDIKISGNIFDVEEFGNNNEECPKGKNYHNKCIK